MQGLRYVFISKASRVSVSSLLSILTPIYLVRLGYSALYVGLALTAILAGNAFFNIILTWYGDYLGRKRSLMIFSLLVVVSGVLLSSTIILPLISSDMEHHQSEPSLHQLRTISRILSLPLDYSTSFTDWWDCCC
jgi:MFS family permease